MSILNKNDEFKLFDMKPPKEDQIHGLEPQGSLGSESCITEKN